MYVYISTRLSPENSAIYQNGESFLRLKTARLTFILINKIDDRVPLRT